jgi:PPOX class probable F420-dependent enzyme
VEPSTPWLDRVDRARVARLATHRRGGGIDVVPLVFARLADPLPYGTLVHAVDHKPKRHERLQRLANLAEDSRATVLVDHYGEDWSALWWVRLRARGRVIAAGSGEASAALAALVAKYPQYLARPPGGALIALDIEAVNGWSAVREW